ncbi:dihydrodipicolinate synthase family protein [Alteromonas sp. BL110]|uniref:dihydrodipicolinate synthase family protein n=1 Tax=Alteromonas sp. BL110 TaxID=1714845 RepID=UPI000E48DB43|nr:dihydrodipicolinate synthase family protein [Alteromonas sp. BL110]AXT38346.1 dihydrodipicolinate synthase family protein [Alteromonas sp. BL110]RKM83910.1 dihydrodipicolinate synthase family protein [Alteromonas sp. BL110]
MFTGLSAFPITPFKQETIDYKAFQGLVDNLASANVDSICAIGSTGLYPYLTRGEKYNVAKLAVDHANGIPVMAGVGSLRTFDVLKNVEAVQQAGVNAVLLAPVSYQVLNEEEVFGLYEAVSREVSVPICIYENPRVTNFTFSDDLYRRLGQLPNIGAIKIPGFPFGKSATDGSTSNGVHRLASLREVMPAHIAIGVSGDSFGAAGMSEGCDLWLSVIGGIFPQTVMRLIEAAQSGNAVDAQAQSQALSGIWNMFARNGGGLRVVAAAAEILGYCETPSLPAPFLPIVNKEYAELEQIIEQLSLS